MPEEETSRSKEVSKKPKSSAEDHDNAKVTSAKQKSISSLSQLDIERMLARENDLANIIKNSFSYEKILYDTIKPFKALEDLQKQVTTALNSSLYFKNAELFKELNSRDYDTGLADQLVQKRNELAALKNKYNEALEGKLDATKQIEELEAKVKEMQEFEKLSFYKTRIHRQAFEFLRANADFKNQFFSGAQQATVISVDIRRSTKLMQIAKSPKQFAQFTSDLAQGMLSIVIHNHGVFDKFTGDGILAYFPMSYSGPDHVTKAITASFEIHKLFSEFYKARKNAFITRPIGLGVGIGIDSGLVNLEEAAGEIYIIGDPVVYACRLGSAPAGQIWANPRIEDNLHEATMDDFNYEVGEAEIKGEGAVEIYNLLSFKKQPIQSTPVWMLSEEK